VAKLRVGDIEIDGSRISIGSPSQAPARAPGEPAGSTARTQATADLASISRMLTALPGTPRTYLKSGAVVSLTAGSVLLLSANLLAGSPLLIPLAVGLVPLVSAGLGMAAIGLLKARFEPKPDVDTSDRALMSQSLAAPETMTRLMTAIEAAGANATFEHLRGELSVSEEALLALLKGAMAAGDVDEDLNLDTGDYYYRAGARPDQVGQESRPRSLDERLQARSQEQGKRSVE